MKNILTLFIALSITASSYGQKQKIDLNLTKGQTYLQNMLIDMTMKQSVGGQEMTIKVGMNASMSYKVVEQIDTVYQIVCKYEKLSMTMGMPNGDMVIDSEGSSNNPMTSFIASLKENPFNIKLSKSGKVVEVSDISKLFDGFSKIPNVTPEQAEQMKAQLSKSYGEEAFKANMELSMSIYPGKLVQVGDSWTSNGKIKSQFKADLQTVYTLKEVTDDYYLVTGVSKINSLKDAISEANGMKMKFNVNGDMQTEMKLNRKTGWVSNGTVNQKITGSTEVLPSEQLPKGMVMPMDMTMKFTISDK